MKQLIFIGISLYQLLVSPLLHALLGQQHVCRYELSCSEYAKQTIKKNGIILGSKQALKRFISCRPHAKPYGTIL